jgi:hypothetical protein
MNREQTNERINYHSCARPAQGATPSSPCAPRIYETKCCIITVDKLPGPAEGLRKSNTKGYKQTTSVYCHGANIWYAP